MVHSQKSKRAYSLVELLTVIALIGVLLAMLFPTLGTVRNKARATACTSNLRQIGSAMAMYAQDYDGLYPFAADPIDKISTNLLEDPEGNLERATMPLLHEVLLPYSKNRDIFHCSADIGIGIMEDRSDADGNPINLNAYPTVFDKFGTSYVWRTEFAHKQKLFAVGGKDEDGEVGPAEMGVVSEMTGAWHGSSPDVKQWSYQCLMGDGHVMRQNFLQNRRSWSFTIL